MSQIGAYPHLSKKGSIGKVQLRNRIIMNPTETLYASASGECTQEVIEFYRRRAKGGVGMIVVHSMQGNTVVDSFDTYAGSLRIDRDAFIPRLSDLTEAVHREGAAIAALVSLGGGARGNGEPYPESDPHAARVAPSAVSAEEAPFAARELSIEEIQESIEQIGKCARRARMAGFDVFYLHAIGSYLLAEFLSPVFNHRQDAYGGSAENRWRIVFELIASCKRYAGKDYPIVLRLSVDEMGENGRTLEETLKMLPLLEQAGIAAFDVTAGLLNPLHSTIPNIYAPVDPNKQYAKAVKAVVSVPVIAGGRISDPHVAEAHLEQGCSDYIGMGRTLIAEPDWVNKTLSGNEAEIRQCLACNYCIGHRIQKKLPLRCAFNPLAGREAVESEIQQPLKRRIAVIGAGPAGLEAACTLAKRGCTVDLYEQTEQLCGGQIRTASAPPCKQTLRHIANYYGEQIRKLPSLRVHLGTRIDKEMIDQLDADVVIAAVGAKPFVPQIAGIDVSDILSAEKVLRGAPTGENVVVLGGGQVGTETAHFLSEQEKNVTIIEALPEIAGQEEGGTRAALLRLLQNNNVRIAVNETVLRIEGHSVYTQNCFTKQESVFPFDTAVTAFGMRPDTELSDAPERSGKTILWIGDAHAVGNVATAIAEGHAVARNL